MATVSERIAALSAELERLRAAETTARDAAFAAASRRGDREQALVAGRAELDQALRELESIRSKVEACERAYADAAREIEDLRAAEQTAHEDVVLAEAERIRAERTLRATVAEDAAAAQAQAAAAATAPAPTVTAVQVDIAAPAEGPRPEPPARSSAEHAVRRAESATAKSDRLRPWSRTRNEKPTAPVAAPAAADRGTQTPAETKPSARHSRTPIVLVAVGLLLIAVLTGGVYGYNYSKAESMRAALRPALPALVSDLKDGLVAARAQEANTAALRGGRGVDPFTAYAASMRRIDERSKGALERIRPIKSAVASFDQLPLLPDASGAELALEMRSNWITPLEKTLEDWGRRSAKARGLAEAVRELAGEAIDAELGAVSEAERKRTLERIDRLGKMFTLAADALDQLAVRSPTDQALARIGPMVRGLNAPLNKVRLAAEAGDKKAYEAAFVEYATAARSVQTEIVSDLTTLGRIGDVSSVESALAAAERALDRLGR